MHNLLIEGEIIRQITAFLDVLDNMETVKYRKKKNIDVILFLTIIALCVLTIFCQYGRLYNIFWEVWY